MLGTGCPSAIGGMSWHQASHRTKDGVNWTYEEVRQVTYFQVDPGTSIRSETAWNYQFGILMFCEEVTYGGESSRIVLV